ncbi:hypothetical protein K4F52_007426 [Lecanicillium sp. MT-2017a]|nr:hypothetical protein K4F52_007426 [Lecanicillium sp. MT-2017a]
MDYQLAQKLRHLLMQHLAWLWKEHPGMIIVTPTTANPGWPIRSESELSYGVSDGDETMRSMNVPVGLMGMGEWCSEESLLRFALDAEEVGESVQRRPPNWVDVLAIAKSLKGAATGEGLS